MSFSWQREKHHKRKKNNILASFHVYVMPSNILLAKTSWMAEPKIPDEGQSYVAKDSGMGELGPLITRVIHQTPHITLQWLPISIHCSLFDASIVPCTSLLALIIICVPITYVKARAVCSPTAQYRIITEKAERTESKKRKKVGTQATEKRERGRHIRDMKRMSEGDIPGLERETAGW